MFDVEYDLCQAIAVAQVDESHAAHSAGALHPSGEGHGLAGIGYAEFSASVGSEHYVYVVWFIVGKFFFNRQRYETIAEKSNLCFLSSELERTTTYGVAEVFTEERRIRKVQFIGNPAYGVHAGQEHGFGIKDYVVADYIGRITAADVFYNFPKIFACDAASVGIEL